MARGWPGLARAFFSDSARRAARLATSPGILPFSVIALASNRAEEVFLGSAPSDFFIASYQPPFRHLHRSSPHEYPTR